MLFKKNWLLNHSSLEKSGLFSLFKIITIILTSLSYVSLSLANPLCPKPLRMGYDIYPPFQMSDPHEVNIGIDLELMKAALKQMGCEIQLNLSPWKRQLILMKNGDLDIVSSASKTTERETFSRFYDPYLKSLNGLFVRSEDFDKYNFDQLKDILKIPNFKLGVGLDYDYGEEYNNLLSKNQDFKNQLVFFPNELKILTDFSSDTPRINGYLGDIIAFPYLAKKNNLENKITLYKAKVDKVSKLYYMYNKKTLSDEFSRKINENINLLIKNGSFDKIVLKYIPEKYLNFIKIDSSTIH